jgi:hypothetical protein
MLAAFAGSDKLDGLTKTYAAKTKRETPMLARSRLTTAAALGRMLAAAAAFGPYQRKSQ